MSKKYTLREPIPENIDELFEVHTPLVRLLLYSRGIEDIETAESFLNPKYESLHDPFLLKGMDKATDRILKAIKENEKIAIFSDYDADGIPGAVVLHDFFKKIGFENFTNYIPHRNEEGFGLSVEAIETLRENGVKLIITIDCGITDVKEVSFANKNKIDVIITDHHTPLAKLPKAVAIINPKQKGDKYPEKMLCGSGVIFKLVQALIKSGKINFPEGQEKWLLDMVGLATLSDMVPLLGENRVLAYYGLKVLQKSPRPGIQKLLRILKIDQRNITEDDIAFMLTPRINAASRMGVSKDAFLLLSTKDDVEAGAMAEHLNRINDERKGVVGSMIREVKKKIDERVEDMRHVLVFGNPDWKPSLLGLVAGSFSDEHDRPAFFWGRESANVKDNKQTVIKGSCRSGGVHVVELMEKVKDILVDYGGHHGAGGFSLLEENIHHLEERLNVAYIEVIKEKKEKAGGNERDKILIDRKLSLDEVSWETWKQVEQFAPFGFENPKPLFLFENIEISSVKLFGKEKNHLELKFKNSKDKDITAIAFFQNGENFSVDIKEGNSVNLVATLEKSNFRNFPELRLRIVDIF